MFSKPRTATKRITLIAILLLVLLSSCDNPFGMNLKNYKENSYSLQDAWLITSSHEYRKEIFEYWKSPTEFERDGFGDCEDFAAYMVYLLGEDASMVAVLGKSVIHAVVKYQGKYIEPQEFGKYYLNPLVLKTYTYKEVMQRATLWGLKAL